MENTFEIDKSHEGVRIDTFLAEQLSIPRGQIQKELAIGKWAVNGRNVKNSYRLKLEDIISKIENNVIGEIRVEESQIRNQSKNINKEKSNSHEKQIAELRRNKAKLEQELTSLKNELLIEKSKIQKQDEDDEQLKSDINLAIGKLDELSRQKFEELQKNTQGRFSDYIKILSEFQEKLNVIRGKKQEKKSEEDENIDKYAVPKEEKVSSPNEYATWFQQKINELTDNNKRLFFECDLLLDYHKKQLEKYSEDENTIPIKAESEENNTGETKKALSIIDDVKQAISDFWRELKKKETQRLHLYKKRRFKPIKKTEKTIILCWYYISCTCLIIGMGYICVKFILEIKW